MAAIPAGILVDTRLLTPISSYNTKAGAEVEAVIATRVCANGGRVVPPGATVRGVVTRVHKVGMGLVHETARIELEFRELDLPDGSSYPVEARLVKVYNARERVDKGGAIHGIRATATLSNRVGERLAFAAMSQPATAIPFFVVASAVLRFPDPEIVYGAGTELDLQMVFPESLGTVSRCAMPQPATSPEGAADLQRIVDGLPYWSYSKRQPQPMDLVNLAFIGSEEEVERAFRAAGWDGTRPNSVTAGFDAVRAIAEDQAYDDAPMRTLLLDGAETGLRYQNSLNTFEKRDHLRVWKWPQEWDGRPVWASAATRDLATTFSLRPFGFTHQIQDDVDLERDKVVSDLEFAGCVDSVAYVRRAQAMRAAGRDYRRGVITDSRVAVVVLKSCDSAAAAPVSAAQPRRPGRLVRGVRRVMLTARNHFLRDNIVWRSADTALLGWRTVAGWRRERKNERLAREALAQQPGAAAK